MQRTNGIIIGERYADEMMHLSRILSQGFPHIRVDWYHANNQLYFGEFTFFNDSGFGAFDGDQDLEIGSWLQL